MLDFGDYLQLISTHEFEVKDNNDTQISASYRTLYLDNSNSGRYKTKYYDKRDDFTFPVVTFPFIGSNILTAPAVGV
jgi:hypothetical protein